MNCHEFGRFLSIKTFRVNSWTAADIRLICVNIHTKPRAIPFEILRGAGLETKNKNVGGGAFAKKRCVGSVRDFFQSAPLRISNGIALSSTSGLSNFVKEFCACNHNHDPKDLELWHYFLVKIIFSAFSTILGVLHCYKRPDTFQVWIVCGMPEMTVV